MKGIKLLPMYAGFRPNDRESRLLWEYATKHGLPVLLHTGTTFISQAPLDCTLPRLLDDVATRFPDVKMILAHIGHPYEGECVVTIRKHPNVYADCSALHYRPFQLYHSLMLLQEYGVWNKLLFGSDYPFTTVDASLEGMRGLNKMLEGTKLPAAEYGQDGRDVRAGLACACWGLPRRRSARGGTRLKIFDATFLSCSATSSIAERGIWCGRTGNGKRGGKSTGRVHDGYGDAADRQFLFLIIDRVAEFTNFGDSRCSSRGEVIVLRVCRM